MTMNENMVQQAGDMPSVDEYYSHCNRNDLLAELGRLHLEKNRVGEELRAELDRMTAAVIEEGYACDGVCNMCMCAYAEARAIREKYGFDKKEQP
jgi:hypothetical protein